MNSSTNHDLLMHHWQQVFPGEILEIGTKTSSTIRGSARRMLDHIGVEWESEVLDFSSLERPVKTASLWQVRQPLLEFEGEMAALSATPAAPARRHQPENQLGTD